MKDLTLQDLLRYGLAGGIAMIFACASYQQPASWLAQKHEGDLFAIAASVLPFLIGVLAYVFHRALPLLVFYRLFSWMCGRCDSLHVMDINRWKNQGKKGAIQPRLSEWGAQVHFLYSSFWAIILVEVVARAVGYSASPWRNIAYAFVAGLFLVAVVHHYRYLSHEKEVFEYDNSLRDDVESIPNQTVGG